MHELLFQLVNVMANWILVMSELGQREAASSSHNHVWLLIMPAIKNKNKHNFFFLLLTNK